MGRQVVRGRVGGGWRVSGSVCDAGTDGNNGAGTIKATVTGNDVPVCERGRARMGLIALRRAVSCERGFLGSFAPPPSRKREDTPAPMLVGT